jgi:hypothetical protein
LPKNTIWYIVADNVQAGDKKPGGEHQAKEKTK